MKDIIAQMNPGSNVAAAFDSSDIKDAVKRLQGEVAGLSKQSHQNTNDLSKLMIQHADTQKVAFTNQQNIQQLSNKVDKLEDLLNKLNRTVNDMQIRMA